MTTPIGTSLQNGKYTLERELGQGGFGVTYIATHHVLGHAVVIKTLNDSLRHEPNFWDFHTQFQEEARRLAKFSHPHIVRVSDFFIENNLPYIVMDFIPGETLKTLVIPNRPLPEVVALHYIRQVADALRVVHQNGLLHRDVKPQNIILRQGTQDVVLIDFGISREFTMGMTQTHTGVLSAGYAPIEQYLPRAKRTPATDVYGLAATLYSLLTAEVPIAAMLRHRQPLPAPRDLRPELSPRVNQAVLHGMALEPEQRPASIEDWLALLPDQPGVAVPQVGNTPATHEPTLALAPPPIPQPHSPQSPAPVYKPPSEWETAYASQSIGSVYGAGQEAVQPAEIAYRSNPYIPSNNAPPQKPPSALQRIGSNPLFVAGLTALGVLIPIALSTAWLKPPSEPSSNPTSAPLSEPTSDRTFEPIQPEDTVPPPSELDIESDPALELEQDPSLTPEETPSPDSETLNETTPSPEPSSAEPSATDSPQSIDTAPPVEQTPFQSPVESSPTEPIDRIEEPSESEEYIPEDSENLEVQNDRDNGDDNEGNRGRGRDRERERGRDKDKDKDD